MIGIVCAMPEELASFLATADSRTDPGDGFNRLRVGEFECVIACRGLGKVQAAMTATTMVERYGCRGLVSAGTAGGLAGIAPLEVLVGTRLIQHDYGRSRGAGEIELYRPGVPPLPAYHSNDYAIELGTGIRTRFRTAAAAIDYVRFGTFVSGDTFVNDNASRERLIALGANAVDMECAAVAQVADSFGLPWLVAKGISDEASAVSHQDFLAGLAEASRRSAEVVRALLPAMSA